jgi:type I restriction enzyme R subunit
MTSEQLNRMLSEVKDVASRAERAKLCRSLLASSVDYIYEQAGEPMPKKATLLELLDSPTVTGFVNDADTVQALHYVRILGMNAEHGRNVRKKESSLSLANMSYFVGLVEAKEQGTEASYQKPPYMSEAETRKLYIDLYLQEAGWDVLDANHVAQPGKACVEIEVQGMPNIQGVGYCDYVLYGRDGKPLAIVEVKKTSVSPESGRHQVDLYGDCMEKEYGYKPVLYYTNGYSTKVIDGIYPDRSVMAFHSMEELELIISRRTRGDITDLCVNDEITNRPYQKMAITNICEWLNKKHRRGLLVMATGTGKTRVSISLVDILIRNNWVKNMLFLADRTTLVNQAKRNFAKLLPDMNVCELSGNGEKDFNARLMFCTYQTMINYIDSEDKRFTTGRFDLIIIDEAHRSIFKRYGSIFRYFDSFLVGLTATPKNEVDANTYSIFGCEAGMPNYDYTLEEAIREHYLVGYHPINRTSRLIKAGIDWNSLTADEREQLDEYLSDDPSTPDSTVPGNKIFRILFNKETCRQVVEELMQGGLRVNNGETLGKSIIFAYNHKHAQMIVECFHELYPDYPANTCQLVDNYVKYADDLVLKFDSDPEFRIAVSVDMLDTGVDIPSILNLVFFKPVRSKIKFIQMIGRGTRLCENLLGPGKHKSGFYIFDYCGNFEFFDNLPEGKTDIVSQSSLTQRLFRIRLDILCELQSIEYQENEWFKSFYDKLKTELHQEIVKIKSHSNRIQVRAAMQHVDKYYDLASWTALSPVSIQEIKSHLVPLLDSGLNGDSLAVAYDCRMYHVALSLICDKNIKAAASDVKKVREIARYLLDEKASVPQVLAKATDLKLLMNNTFWANPNIAEIERLRASLRDLMQFLQGEGQKQYDIDISDDVTESGYQPGDTIIDIRTYREKVFDYLMENMDSPVIHKIYNLQPIDENDLQELEHILWHELGSKEDYNETTNMDNLAAFVRSLVGLSQEAVNEKFGEYLNGTVLNSVQQEFVHAVINYARENGDVKREDMVNTAPFNNYDLTAIFGVKIRDIIKVVDVLHKSITTAVA